MVESARILVVDPDDGAFADYSREFLAQPWQVDRVRTLAEAEQLVANSIYNIAIVDVRLPDGVGTDAWNALKAKQPGLFGIFTTSSRVLYRSINVCGEGVMAFLLKPLQAAAISNLISATLELQNILLQTRGAQSERHSPGGQAADPAPLAAGDETLLVIRDHLRALLRGNAHLPPARDE